MRDVRTRDRRFTLCALALVIAAAATASSNQPPQAAPPQPSGRRLIAPSDFVRLGYYDVRVNGQDSTWGQGFTHRIVDGDLRFFQLTGGATFAGRLVEFSLAGKAFGSLIDQRTGTWDIRKAQLTSFKGLSWDATTSKMLVTVATDYTVEFIPASVRAITLNADGTIAFTIAIIDGLTAKRMYGSCAAVPASWKSAFPRFANSAYVCGNGGYTSLVLQGGGAAIGPTLYGLPDVTVGGSIRSGSVRPIIEVAPAGSRRGVRLTLPINYYDSGTDTFPGAPDPGATPPAYAPRRGADWQSPNSEGLGWMVWGDSYYNTGMLIETPTRYGYVAVMSGCGGKCWYGTSTLHSQFRRYEWHVFDPATMNRTQRPAAMAELTIPGITGKDDGGNGPWRNVSGATFVPETNASSPYAGKVYTMSCWLDDDPLTCRLTAWGLTK